MTHNWGEFSHQHIRDGLDSDILNAAIYATHDQAIPLHDDLSGRAVVSDPATSRVAIQDGGVP